MYLVVAVHVNALHQKFGRNCDLTDLDVWPLKSWSHFVPMVNYVGQHIKTRGLVFWKKGSCSVAYDQYFRRYGDFSAFAPWPWPFFDYGSYVYILFLKVDYVYMSNSMLYDQTQCCTTNTLGDMAIFVHLQRDLHLWPWGPRSHCVPHGWLYGCTCQNQRSMTNALAGVGIAMSWRDLERGPTKPHFELVPAIHEYNHIFNFCCPMLKHFRVITHTYTHTQTRVSTL